MVRSMQSTLSVDSTDISRFAYYHLLTLLLLIALLLPILSIVLRQVKAYNDMEYSCNGGAFFWVAEKDVGGSWSDLVWEEVKTTSGELVVASMVLRSRSYFIVYTD